MNKADLRRMIRKIVREEILRELPDLINEAISDVIRSQSRPATRRPTRQLQENVRKERQPRDLNSLRNMLGYGDMVPGQQGEEDVPRSRTQTRVIAGVPVEGGLAEYESRMGMVGVDEETSTVGHQRPGSSDAIDIVARAIGNASKVLEESRKYENYRPGKR